MTGVLMKRENLDTDTQGKCAVKIGFMQPQAKELAEAGREAWNRSFPIKLREYGLANTLVLDFQPQNLIQPGLVWGERKKWTWRFLLRKSHLS